MRELQDIYVIDDLISADHADYLEMHYSGHEIDWFFQKDITYNQSDERHDNLKSHNIGFANLIYPRENGASPLYHTMAPIMYNALSALQLKPIQLLRARAFLQLPIAGQNNEINHPHRDLPISHTVILYYLTDADGDTIIYNETEESEKYTVKDKIQPKKGRCVIFNGKHFHSSSKPTSNIRATLNINVII